MIYLLGEYGLSEVTGEKLSEFASYLLMLIFIQRISFFILLYYITIFYIQIYSFVLIVLFVYYLCNVLGNVYAILTLRRLMSYIYGAPILDVSRSHTTTQHSR